MTNPTSTVFSSRHAVLLAIVASLATWGGCVGNEGTEADGSGAAQTGGVSATQGVGGSGGDEPEAGGGPAGGGGQAAGSRGGGENQPGRGGGGGKAAAGGSPGGGGVAAGGAGGAPGSGAGGSGGMPGGSGGMPGGSGAGGSGGMPGGSGEPAELTGITDLHNRERRKVGVPGLAWDPALAAIAQAWAAKCTDKDAPSGLVDHNPNRGVGYQGSVGENIFGSTATPSAQQAVGSWVGELQSYNYAQNTCSGVCGHYTQVVWKTTQKVGCAVYTCNSLKFSGTLVCNYSPAGNVNGQRPY